jgi:putative DNA methylase
MIEIPPKFAGMPPINPDSRKSKTLFSRKWHAAQGLADDLRYYGKWMRTQAEKRIGNLYPQLQITAAMAKDRPDLKPLIGEKLTVVAWLWARTVKSPNPAFKDVDVPLASTFMLSTKPGREAYIEPVISGNSYTMVVRVGKPKEQQAVTQGTKLARGANFKCLMSGTPIASRYVYSEAKAGRMNSRMLAIIAEGQRGRVYLSPTTDAETIAQQAKPRWKPDVPMPDNPRWFSPPLYGMTVYGDLFTPRQLLALTTFSDLVQEAHQAVCIDATAAGVTRSDNQMNAQKGAKAYADAIATYLGLAVGRSANYWSSLTPWGGDFIVQTFGRQAIPMVYDHAEANPMSDSTGNWNGALEWIAKVIETTVPASGKGEALQKDAQTQTISLNKLVSTDPPYYDNVGYADLSDFFYVWLRRSLQKIYPDLFVTVAVPKADELVATPYRHGTKEKAEKFFLEGMAQAMRQLSEEAHPASPVTIYYAFRQSESEGSEGTASTGWETFLDAVIRAGFAISGTWPMRTERDQGLKTGVNALASSIVLVCRSRDSHAPIATRREFISALKSELPTALAHLQRGNIAPVDLAQAAIGPGMAVYTRYSRVVDADGKAMPVREALSLINQILDEVLSEQEGDFDADTRWALTWFEDVGFAEGEYGKAEQLSKSKNTSVNGMMQSGILLSKSGKVRLKRPDELSTAWNPLDDSRLTVWESVHHLIRRLEKDGEAGAAELVSPLGGMAEVARELAYRLYVICERKKRAQEALSYNALVQSWPEITRIARESSIPRATQAAMFAQE